MDETAFMAHIDNLEADRTTALIEFAVWFWSSIKGGFARYLQDYPKELRSVKAALDLAQGDEELWELCRPATSILDYADGYASNSFTSLRQPALRDAIKDCSSLFKDPDDSHPFRNYDLIRVLDIVLIMEAVEAAWRGAFGRLPLLSEDPGYEAWLNQYIDSNIIRICPKCRKGIISRMAYCGTCGGKLPDHVFHEDLQHGLARMDLAKQRGYDLDDVPDEDVEKEVGNMKGTVDTLPF